MRQMASMSMLQKLKMITGMGKAGMFQPGGENAEGKDRHGQTDIPKERAEKRKKKRKQDKKK